MNCFCFLKEFEQVIAEKLLVKLNVFVGNGNEVFLDFKIQNKMRDECGEFRHPWSNYNLDS